MKAQRTLAQPTSIRAALGFLIATLGILIMATTARADTTAVDILRQEAENLKPLASTDVARQFLEAVPYLPLVAPRPVYINAETKQIISPAAHADLPDSVQSQYTRRELTDKFYYNTRYGSPLAFVRALDLTAQAGLSQLSGARIIDFGFGSIGQLRLMASLGAEATGIEVDPVLPLLYNQPEDTGRIAPVKADGVRPAGRITLLFGQFPADPGIRAAVGTGYDAFISKNTLKRGYIHPSREVDPKMLVHLGVDDSTFVAEVHRLLKPGGVFMIYNLHPAESKPDEPYKPWSDGRCPFDRSLLERTGFEIVEYDRIDTPFAHTMARAFGWDEQMNLDTDMLATYTLLRKLR